jgi:hypothetical protein
VGPDGKWGTDEKGIRAGEEALLASALEAVQDLNERCLTILFRLALGPAGSVSPFIAALATQFRGLDPSKIPHIARQPFLFVDFAFGKPKVLRQLLARGPAPLRFPCPSGSLPAADATAMARGTLILAQAVCRHHPAHAGLLLGIDPSLRAALATLRLADLERLAEEHPQNLRVRWENRPDIWRHLLSATGATDPTAHSLFRLYGMQLIAGDLKRKVPGILQA